MASIAIMVGGAVLNAVTFIGGKYLARFLLGVDQAAQEENNNNNNNNNLFLIRRKLTSEYDQMRLTTITTCNNYNKIYLKNT